MGVRAIETVSGGGISSALAPACHARAGRQGAWAYAGLVAILLAAGMLRFSGLDREGRWCDEYYQTACYDSSPRYVVMCAQSDSQPPLDYLLGWALAKIDRSVWMMRAPAAFFGVCGVAGCFFLVRRVASPPAGLLAAALLALSPLHWKLSQTARPYTIFIAAFLLMLWTLVRAIERPDRRRLVVFALSAFVMALTRGLIPLVVLLATGITLAAACVATRFSADVDSRAAYRGLRRVALTTVGVGVAVLPLVIFLLMGDQGWTVFSKQGGNVATEGGTPFLARLASNALTWWNTLPVMFGVAGSGVLVLALGGALLHLVRWRHLPWATRCLCGVSWLIGPLDLFVFTSAVRDWPMAERYCLFMVPVGAMFAAIAAVELVKRMNNARWGRMAGAVLVVLLLASPAWPTLNLTDRYFYPDWQGCAAYLSDKVTADDVIMVVQDRPLGEYQPTFWGKHDWPKGVDRPLAESVWTLATSENHWKRLIERKGRCYVVIRNPMANEGRDDYLGTGVQIAPEGMTLRKFRGLDLLCGASSTGDPRTFWITACNVILKLDLQHPDVKATPLTLRSRLQLALGDQQAAAESYRQARALVSPQLRPWYESATGRIAAELGQ